MADGLYDHSGNSPRIQNPMRFFGAMTIIKGFVIAIIAAMTLFLVKENLKINPILGYVTTALGFILMGVGISNIATGFQASFRLFVGRTLPISLALNKEETDQANANLEKRYLRYTAVELTEQLKKRVNTSFTEPTGWMAGLLATFYPNFIIQPKPIRGVMLGVFSAASKTIIALIVMGTVWFASASGLAGEAGALVEAVTMLILSLYVAFVWSRIGYDDTISSNGQIARALSVAILAPVLTGYLYQQYSQIRTTSDQKVEDVLASAYSANFDEGLLFVMIVLFAVVASVVAVALLVTRQKMDTRVKVAEVTDNIQSNFKPQDLFNNMEAMIWRNYREGEIPNRVYQKSESIRRLSDIESEVAYEQLLESQPKHISPPRSTQNRVVRALAAFLFALFGVLSVAILYSGLQNGAELFTSNDWLNSASKEVFATGLINFVVSSISYVVLAWVVLCMSKSIAKILMPFISEVHWESRVMHFEMRGSANESRHVAGNAILDSHSTENVISRCSLTPWLWAAKIQTTSFVNLYGKGLRSPRVIMSFEEDHQSGADVFCKIGEFINSRVNVTTVAQSEHDLKSTLALNSLNNHAKSNSESKLDLADLLVPLVRKTNPTNAASAAVAAEAVKDRSELSTNNAGDADNAGDLADAGNLLDK